MKLSWFSRVCIFVALASCNPVFAAYAKPSLFPSGFFENAAGSPVLDLINQARTSLKIEIYEMDDPKVIEAIRKASKRGVAVHIVKEPKPVGSACRVFETEDEAVDSSVNDVQMLGGASCEDQRKLVKEVIGAGGKYVPFKKPDLCGGNGTKNCLQHGKLVIADSRAALISTGNFNTTSLCDAEFLPMVCNRDYSYVTVDRFMTKALQNIFEKDALGKRYDPGKLLNADMAAKLTVGPDSLDSLISFIRSARREIQIENQYLKDPIMNEAIIQAAKRGVNVRAVIASACSFARPSEAERKRLTLIFQDFDQAGIVLKMFNKKILVGGRAGYMHAKAIVVDGQKAWLGSVNGSTQALTLNREFGIFFDDRVEVAKLISIMEKDFNDPNVESWQQSLDCAENT